MKILSFILLLIIVVSCKKEDTPLVPGGYYHLKGDLYRKGQFQPIEPVYLKALHGDSALCVARIDWPNFVLLPTDNIKLDLVKANQVIFKNLNMKVGDTTKIEWVYRTDELIK